MSDDELDASAPPPASRSTGTFNVFASSALMVDMPPEQAFASSLTSQSSPHSSFRWERCESFRLYASHSRAMLRRATSFGLPGSQPTDGTPSPQLTAKASRTALKNYISMSASTAASSESALPRSIIQGPRIGAGGYASVYAGINTLTGELIAIKEISVAPNTPLSELRMIEDEFALLRTLRHDNIVQYLLFEHSISQRVCRIVMEFCSCGSLQGMTERFGPIPDAPMRSFARQILLGLQFIHSDGITHRDIKPANILLHHDGSVKLADFGASKRLTEINLQASHLLGTPIYMAPEFIKGQMHQKSDIWAVGCTILELITGLTPWHHTKLRDSLALMFHISTSSDTPHIPHTVNDECRSFLERCFVRDIGERPDAKELLEDPWIIGASRSVTEDPTKVPSSAIDLAAQLCIEICDSIMNKSKAKEVEAADVYQTQNATAVLPAAAADSKHLAADSGSVLGHSIETLDASPHSFESSSPPRVHAVEEEEAEVAAPQFLVLTPQMVGPLAQYLPAENCESEGEDTPEVPSIAVEPMREGFPLLPPPATVVEPPRRGSGESQRANQLAPPLDSPRRSSDSSTRETTKARVEIPIEACGQSFSLNLNLNADDLEMRVINRKKSIVLSMNDHVRKQIQEALQHKSSETPSNSPSHSHGQTSPQKNNSSSLTLPDAITGESSGDGFGSRRVSLDVPSPLRRASTDTAEGSSRRASVATFPGVPEELPPRRQSTTVPGVPPPPSTTSSQQQQSSSDKRSSTADSPPLRKQTKLEPQPSASRSSPLGKHPQQAQSIPSSPPKKVST